MFVAKIHNTKTNYFVSFLLVLSVAMLVTVWPAYGQRTVPPMPKDVEKTRVSLMTVGSGEALYSRYGHSMLRVMDSSNNVDYLVNWGIFDYSDPLFIPKFFSGVMIYQLGFTGTGPTIDYYREVERRPIVESELILTPRQKRKLFDKIFWNALPENYKYPYQYFRNNCATITRDYLNEVLGGALKSKYQEVSAGVTYRDYSRQNFASNTIVGWGLDVLFNSDTDRVLSRWEEMFYPPKLREYLAKMPSVDDEGRAHPYLKLLSQQNVLVNLPEPRHDAIDGYYLTWVVSGGPLMVIGMMMLVGWRRSSLDLPAWCFRLFGFVSLWWGMTHGFFGLVHSGAWMFSSHTDFHRNVNMIIFWPIDMLVLVLGIQMGILDRQWRFKGRLSRGFWHKFAKLHIVSLLAFAIISISGLSSQNTDRVLAYLAPLSLLYYTVMARLTRCESASRPEGQSSYA